VIANMPSYGYARVWAILRREAIAEGRGPANRKRIYRVMRAHGLLLQRHAGGHEERRHDGKIAVERSNLRWCSDGFESDTRRENGHSIPAKMVRSLQ
jgi:putative transposase